MIKDCQICHKKFNVATHRNKTASTCSWKCRSKWMKRYTKENSPHWKGGKAKTISGYMLIRINDRYFYEHRYVMEQHLKRKLKNNEAVHHINGIKSDNRLKNLIVMKKSKHDTLHLVPFKKGYDKRRRRNPKN